MHFPIEIGGISSLLNIHYKVWASPLVGLWEGSMPGFGVSRHPHHEMVAHPVRAKQS